MSGRIRTTRYGLAAASLTGLLSCSGPPAQSPSSGRNSDNTTGALRAQSAGQMPLGPASMRTIKFSNPTLDVMAERSADVLMRRLRKAAGAFVIEGVIAESEATVAQIPSVGGQQQTIVTRYRMKVNRAWGRDTGSAVEYWVLGGTLPAKDYSQNHPYQGEGYSDQSYPRLGEQLIIALRTGEFAAGFTANVEVLSVRAGAPSVTSGADGGVPSVRDLAIEKARGALDTEYSSKYNY